MAKTLIHIGMPKAASTAIQMSLLCRCPLWEFVGIEAFGAKPASDWGRQALKGLWYLGTAEEWQYRKQITELQQLFTKRRDDDRPILISDERLTTSHYFTSSYPYVDRYLVARRLCELLPNAKILLIIRNQFTFLPSLYGEMLRHGCLPKRSFRHWLQLQIDAARDGKSNALPIAHYGDIGREYAKLFGNDNISIVLFEQYVRDPLAVYAKIATHTGLQWNTVEPYVEPSPYRNARPSAWELFLVRCYHDFNAAGRMVPRPIRRSIFSTAKRFTGFRYEYSDAEREFLSCYYQEGNRYIAQHTSLDLQEHGYPL